MVYNAIYLLLYFKYEQGGRNNVRAHLSAQQCFHIFIIFIEQYVIF